jgi:hypothetical protein
MATAKPLGNVKVSRAYPSTMSLSRFQVGLYVTTRGTAIRTANDTQAILIAYILEVAVITSPPFYASVPQRVFGRFGKGQTTKAYPLPVAMRRLLRHESGQLELQKQEKWEYQRERGPRIESPRAEGRVKRIRWLRQRRRANGRVARRESSAAALPDVISLVVVGQDYVRCST